MRHAAAYVLFGATVWLGTQAPAVPPPPSGLPPADYSLGPDSQPQPGVPKGAVTRHVLAPGKFFPGTPHNYQVYVPAQCDPGRPLPFMIFLDGGGYAGDNVRVPVVLDNLIAKRDLPPMAAIFIDPGVMPALSEAAQNRYERIFEYDSLTPRFANFLVEELIPEVSKLCPLSSDPNERGIAGLSTGGVGAFVAAWNRPDQFRRVITWIGSFGNFRGADRLPGLIRRTEPRPIRVFMQTGRQDLVNYAGSWYLENPRMAAALEFAGNDVKIELGEDGHSNRHGASMLPDTLRWLWRGYPQPVSVGEAAVPGMGRGIFAQLVPRRELVPPPPNPSAPAPAQGRGAPAAGRGSGPRGAVYALISPRQIMGTRRRLVQVRDQSGGRQGRQRLLRRSGEQQDLSGRCGRHGDRVQGQYRRRARASCRRRRAAVRGAAGGEAPRLLRTWRRREAGRAKSRGQRSGADQDRRDLLRRHGTQDGRLHQPHGERRVVYERGEIMSPSALTLTPDQAMLLVGDAMDRFQWSFQIAADGSLTNGEPFQRLEMPEEGLFSGVAGLAADTLGYMWATSAIGIQVCEQPGRCTNILNKPEFNASRSAASRSADRSARGCTSPRADDCSVAKRSELVPWYGNRSSRRSQDCEPVVKPMLTASSSRRVACGRRRRAAGHDHGRRRRLQRGAGESWRGRLRGGLRRLSPRRPERQQRSSAEGRAIRARLRRQGSEDAVHEGCRHDAAQYAGEPYYRRVSRCRRAHVEGERIQVRGAGVDGGCARGDPRRARTTQAGSAGRRFLLCRSGRLPHRRSRAHVDADPRKRTGGGGPVRAGAGHRRRTTGRAGTQTFHLLDAMAYAPDDRKGQTIYVRGLLIKLAGEPRMTISTFETVSPTCRD